MARLDLDTAQLRQLDAFEVRHEPFCRGGESVAQVMQTHLLRFRRLPSRLARPLVSGKAHPPGTAERRAAGIAGVELGIDSSRDLRIGHASDKIVPQRSAMLRRPVGRFHFLPVYSSPPGAVINF